MNIERKLRSVLSYDKTGIGGEPKVVMTIMAGSMINWAIEDAIVISMIERCPVHFRFNGDEYLFDVSDLIARAIPTKVRKP